ncbi:ribosomal protein L34 isoform X2 [Wolffia australiana]
MAAKALAARPVATLIGRLFAGAHPLTRLGGVDVPPQITGHSSGSPFPSKFQVATMPADEEAAAVKNLFSSGEICFPCGLPSLRFFLEEARRRRVEGRSLREELLKAVRESQSEKSLPTDLPH